VAAPRRLSLREAERLLYREARLLDERRLDEWLDLFAPDGVYWLPIAEDGDPTREPSLLFDDSAQRVQRVFQLLHTPRHAQRPPSRTIHLLANVELDEGVPEADSAVVYCSMVVFELRPGDRQQIGLGEQRAFAARCEYRLRYTDAWRIVLKKVLLINRDLPLYNLSFIL
jgi:ethylbenzene dioxygenase subunit beta